MLLGERTFRLVRGAVRAEPVPPLDAKGKSEPVQAYRLLEVSSVGPVPRRAGTPFAGREDQLQLLEREFDAVVAGRECRLVTVVGEPGVGKSRLTAELVAQIGARARVVRGRCLSYGEGITFWAIGEIVRELAGIHDEHSIAQARALVEAHVEGATERACRRGEDRAAARARGGLGDRAGDRVGDPALPAARRPTTGPWS